ncbi:SUN domain-containing protein 1 isoform X4 [Lutra lutra]|uniref:SUN domain-containing protein 1 isoform X4 n=1 Tax=Lutra lutra TaxID=9657 RepID=UPI001FCF9C59|nr:SUN domain-containing protein 1 isoform X4 [Lutra lutra]
MSRRSLRLVTTTCAVEDGQAGDAHFCTNSAVSLKDRVARTVKQRRSTSKPALSINHSLRKAVSCAAGQSGASTLSGAACLRPPVLDESLIREQTKVDHFWGLDDDGDLKGGNKAATQGNGDLAAEGTRSNGYTCSDCLLLSERKDTLTVHSAPHGASPRLYSRNMSQKQESVSLKGKAASGIFWWLGIGWYQFVTLISWLNVFLLTRCLRTICMFLILLIPLLLLLGAGLSLYGQGDLLSGLPVLNWTRMYGAWWVGSPESTFTPDTSHLHRPLEEGDKAYHWHRMSEVEREMTLLSGQCRNHDEKLRELAAVLQHLQARVDQMDGDSEGTLSLVQRVVGQHLKEMGADRLSGSQSDAVTVRQEQELRLSNLEDLLGKLTEKSEAIQKELEQTKLRTASGAEEEQRLLSVVTHLELELGRLKSELSSWQHLKSSCEEVRSIHGKVDAQVRETVRLLFSDGEQGGSPDWLLRALSSRFVSRDDLQALLRDLELQILKNITHYISVTKQVPDSETVVSAAKEAGVSGITEAQARVIVNNALKLYSQDKTGMVDFALESGGGSILSTRCSETYETKTALISLFGIPLWYFSQSPRIVIQPDIHPGNCWAFRGSQGYLVVRLSMKIRPTTFTLEHIPKTLSPTGNITSAPKDFAVYGLDNEYQEEGQLLGQFVYDQEGESLQMFHVLKRPDGAFQIVELRILSNWGHPEYTCLYRFRVHGEPVK